MKTILVTGGAGFIGSNFVRYMLKNYEDITLVNLDLLTYAGNLDNLAGVSDDKRYTFLRAISMTALCRSSFLRGTALTRS